MLRNALAFVFTASVLAFALAGRPHTPPPPAARAAVRPGERCTSLIVGKDASAEGTVLLAHNEDLGNYAAQHYLNVPAAQHAPGETVTSFYGARVPQAETTYAYTGTTVFDISYLPGAITSGVNEHQLVVVNNMSYRRDADDPLPAEGRLIWTEFTRFALERAKTAREAVEVIGGLAQTYKLGADSGAIFGAADPDEGWWIEVTQDGQWAAQRVRDDEVSARANIFRIGVIDCNDTQNFRCSDDLVSYAANRGWYTSGPFDFTAVYADPAKTDNPYNTRRTWRISELLDPKKPAVSVADIMAVLRDHYEGTPYDLTAAFGEGSPHQTLERTLCAAHTELSVVCRPRADLPAEIGALCWRALATPCVSVFTPWRLGSRRIPREYRRGTANYTRHSAYWVFRALYQAADPRYAKAAPKLRRMIASVERKEFTKQARLEREAAALYARQPAAARRLVARSSARAARQAILAGERMLRSL